MAGYWNWRQLVNRKIVFYSRPFPRIDSYYKLIDLATSYGMEAVEGFCHMELADTDTTEATRIRAYADEKGIKFCCFSVFCNIVGDDREQEIERLKRFTDVAVILGSPYIHHTIASEIFDPAMVLPMEKTLFKLGIQAVREIFDYAAAIGIRSIYENQGYIFNGVRGFGEFLDQVDRPVGILADFGNICQVGESITDFIRAYAARICHVHLKDVVIRDKDPCEVCVTTLDGKKFDEVPIGDGSVDFAAAIRLLKNVGYTGYYSLECSAPADTSLLIDYAIRDIEHLLR